MMNKSLIRNLTLAAGAFAAASSQASTDYGPAIWHPICNANWYSSGSGHKFFVIHDMEGYYASTINWFDNCSMSSASVHFAVNGKKDATSDAPEGEITQLGVRTAQYAWHATCWNQHSLGTEHEGFASNPAWYTDAMYQTSADCVHAMADAFGFAKDRNHVVGHGEKSNTAWRNWAGPNLGINASCNTHTDPGPNWDWNKFMSMVNGAVNNANPVGASYPGSVTTGQSFSASITMNNNGTKAWVDSASYNLGSQNPQDNSRWGLGRVGVAGTVNPGANFTFNFNCTAPGAPGTYPFDWRMVQDGVEWFGTTSTGSIVVNAPTGKTEVIKDNTQATYVGTWATGSSSTDKYGADYRYHSTAAVSEPATFSAALNVSAAWNVRAWWPAGSNRSTTTPYVISHDAGSTTVNKNQQINGGSWQLLGTWNMSGTKDVKVSCWTATGFLVMADAVKWD
jgi:N-acetyl-anhydromuramyl-L-alanine amidase AmpD